ncbi:MAG: hypothetical protein VYD57_13995 [Pseudomonadota bacterium]|nr:hypothetical protein [Pseudomonadota bacterium]
MSRHYKPFEERAVSANAAIERRTHSDLPDPRPAIRFRTTDLGKLRIEVTLFCPSQEAEMLESEITLELLVELKKPDRRNTITHETVSIEDD